MFIGNKQSKGIDLHINLHSMSHITEINKWKLKITLILPKKIVLWKKKTSKFNSLEMFYLFSILNM